MFAGKARSLPKSGALTKSFTTLDLGKGWSRPSVDFIEIVDSKEKLQN
jgi:hypothetical protein